MIFDQFEELFTYPDIAISGFKKQVAELLYSPIPERYFEVLEMQKKQLSKSDFALLHEELDVKIIFAIRSDRMSLLEQISDYLPVKRSWFELAALKANQAEDAILLPAYNKGNFVSPIFDYEDEAIEHVLEFLTKNGQTKIESFQLQIVCQAIERKVIYQNLSIISLSDVGNLERVFENYYDDQIALLENETEQLAARRLIEEGLIYEKEKRRLTLYEGQIHNDFNVSKDLLRKLINTHLLRAEPSLRGGYYYLSVGYD